MTREEMTEKTKSERNEFLNKLARFFLGSVSFRIAGGSIRFDPPDKVLLELRYIQDDELKERLDKAFQDFDLVR